MKVPTMIISTGWANFLPESTGDRRFFVVGSLPTPPVGTPGARPHGGNSTPARTLVAGVGKSERCGERRGAK